MNRSKIVSLFFWVALLSGCKVLSKQIVGHYIDTAHGDTLQIRTDHSYQFLEKLNTGITGATHGKWEVKKSKIYFKSKPKPLVGYRLKVIRDSTSNNFSIKLLLADSYEPIHIEKVSFFKDGTTLDEDNFQQSKNVVRIFSKDFDSMVVQTFNFTNIRFQDTLNKNYGYVARIYPVERLYELDKVPFKIKRKILKSTQTSEYKHIFLTLKKYRADDMN